MIPVVTPDEMRAIDAAAPEPIEVLIERAGAAVAREALRMLGGGYGRTVHLIAGKGNNGADGRAAARRLERRGVRCRIHDAADPPAHLPPADLVIDAAYGTGFRGDWSPPTVGDTPVLAVDVVSGLDGVTGRAAGRVIRADRTITFQALKPGHLLGDGPSLSGDVVVADIGLDVSAARRQLMTADGCARRWPRRPPDDHKWRAAVRLVAGSAEMPGAAVLAASAASRAGAGLVSLAVPGTLDDQHAETSGRGVDAPAEIVQRFLPATRFAPAALDGLDRFSALVVGPGLGRGPAVLDAAREVVRLAAVPTVVDGDGITAVAETPEGAPSLLGSRSAPAVLTPHDGEFERLAGHRPGPDRLAHVVEVASRLGTTVLLKGPTTIVATPDGSVRFVDHGDARLATAGTGDVLSGIIGALLARRLDPLDAAAIGAWVHADAGRVVGGSGLVAGDLVGALPAVVARLGDGDVDRRTDVGGEARET